MINVYSDSTLFAPFQKRLVITVVGQKLLELTVGVVTSSKRHQLLAPVNGALAGMKRPLMPHLAE